MKNTIKNIVENIIVYTTPTVMAIIFISAINYYRIIFNI